MFIDGVYPVAQKLPLRLVLLGVLPLYFQNNGDAVRQPDQKVWPVLLYDALPDEENLETEMIVLNPRFDFLGPVQLIGFRRLPRAVINGKIDVALLCELTGPAGVPRAHVASVGWLVQADEESHGLADCSAPAVVFEAGILQAGHRHQLVAQVTHVIRPT